MSIAQPSRREFLQLSAALGAAGLPSFSFADADAEDSPWQIGIYTRPWDKYDYRVALDAIAAAGYRHGGLMTTGSTKNRLVISVDTTPEEALEVARQVKARRLKVVSVYGGGIPVDKSLAAGIEGMKKLIDNCAACGSSNLLMGGIGSEKLYDAYYTAIKQCCDYAARKGVGISVKPHGGLNATGPQCRTTVQMVDHPNFRIWYDAGNIYYYSDAQLSPVQDAPTVAGLVNGWCIKDYIHPKNVAVTPGAGMVDFPAVFTLLQKGGFKKGPLVVECLTPGDETHLLAEAKKARRFLEELTQHASPGKTRSAPLKAGIAVTDITPPTGYRMSGYFHERLSTGTLNPLHAKALVLKQGPRRIAIVCCDIIGLSPDVTSAARRQAAAKTGFLPANILIAATHTHTGPLYWGALRNHFHDKALAASGTDTREPIDYAAHLTDRIVQAVCNADAAAKPVRLRAGSLTQQGLSFNRRFHMKDGTVRFNPGVLNPDIVKVAGPIDPQVGVLFIDDNATGRPAAALVNFALHLDTTGGTLCAADYPFYLEQKLRQQYGDHFTLFFGTGACGDINHIDVTTKERLKTETIGTTLGQTVLAAADKLAAASPDIAAASATVHAPLQQYTPEELAWATENINKVGTPQLPFLEQVRAYKILALKLRGGDTIPLEVQVMRISRDVAIVALPGEVFVDLGLTIKNQSPFKHTLIIELSQDAPGYIPTKKAFAEGSYETVNSRIAPGGGEMMVQKAVDLLKALHST